MVLANTVTPESVVINNCEIPGSYAAPRQIIHPGLHGSLAVSALTARHTVYTPHVLGWVQNRSALPSYPDQFQFPGLIIKLIQLHR